MTNERYEAKATIVVLNIFICVTLFFASYAVYVKDYSHNNLAVGAEVAEAEDSRNWLMVTQDNETVAVDSVIVEPMNIVLYRFEEVTPQPMTYYTDLLEIKNTGNEPQIINVQIKNIQGQDNLGRIVVWFFENQTDTPESTVALAKAQIDKYTISTVDLISNYVLEGNQTRFIELAGFAAITAEIDSKITFDFVVESI